MLIGVLLAMVLVSVTMWFHYRVLRALSDMVPRLALRFESRILVIVAAAFVAHLLEALAYGVGYLAAEALSLGELTGPVHRGTMDYFYFSVTTYTSLGLGDVSPTGHLRFLAGIEPLNGLLLIAWSGSYTYLAMSRLWPWQACR